MPDATTTPIPAAVTPTPTAPPAPVQATPTAPAPAVPTPDALLIPASMKKGATQRERADTVCSLAESILGAKPGQTAFITVQPGGWLFARFDFNDKLGYPTVGPPPHGDRYVWKTQPSGIRYGYLKEKANA